MESWLSRSAAALALLLAAAGPGPAQPWRAEQQAVPGGTRTYWHIQIPQFQDFVKHNGGPYVCTAGTVMEVRREPDAAYRIRLEVNEPRPPGHQPKFVVLGILPEYLMTVPATGWVVEACGVRRWDDKFRQHELHPLLSWRRLT